MCLFYVAQDRILYKLCRNDAYCLKEKSQDALYCRCAASTIPDKLKNLISRLMLAQYICKSMDGRTLCLKWS